ncbi:MAG: DUF2239 family protein [Bryobacteraceae bacterium]|jgi:uncharacterized protein
MEDEQTWTAFVGETLIASGTLAAVLRVLKARFDQGRSELVLVFEDQSGKQFDFDLRGTLKQVLERALPLRLPRSGPGRPKLGVVSREVSLLPRQWEWLERQPNGASAALRRLIDLERRRQPAEQRARQAVEAVGRFLSAMAGNFPDYEEATRALWASNRGRFDELIRYWPRDIQLHARRLLDEAGGRLCESNTPAA